MSKLLDRLHIHHDAPETLQETTEQVPESAEVAEHRLRVTPPPSHAASKVRWLRWVPVVALFAAGILAVTMLVSDNTTDEPVIEVVGYPTTGPGSPSLGPTPVPAPAMGDVGYPTTGPGSPLLGPTD